MSFKSILKVAGKNYNVLSVNYGLFQETDATGRPSTVSRGGKIDITVESTGARLHPTANIFNKIFINFPKHSISGAL